MVLFVIIISTAAVLLVLGFAVAVALAEDPKPAEANPCATIDKERNLKNSNSGEGFFGAWHCMTYTHCKDKKAETNHCFGWPLLPIRLYSPSAQECKWFWQAKCTENDA